MPTTLGQEYSTSWRGKPPHMLAPDIPIWYRFLAQHAADFEKLYYDCRLGGTALPPGDRDDPMARMSHALLSKRADAIAETSNETWLIEVSASPGMRALGQLLTYHELWKQDPQLSKTIRLILVADQVDPDISPAYARHVIDVFLV